MKTNKHIEAVLQCSDIADQLNLWIVRAPLDGIYDIANSLRHDIEQRRQACDDALEKLASLTRQDADDEDADLDRSQAQSSLQ